MPSDHRRPRPTSARQAAIDLSAKNNALLDVLNAILLAHGQGPEKRLAVSNVYYKGQPRRQIAMEQLGDRFVVYLITDELPIEEVVPPTLWQRIMEWIKARLRQPQPAQKEDTDGNAPRND